VKTESSEGENDRSPVYDDTPPIDQSNIPTEEGHYGKSSRDYDECNNRNLKADVRSAASTNQDGYRSDANFLTNIKQENDNFDSDLVQGFHAGNIGETTLDGQLRASTKTRHLRPVASDFTPTLADFAASSPQFTANAKKRNGYSPNLTDSDALAAESLAPVQNILLNVSSGHAFLSSVGVDFVPGQSGDYTGTVSMPSSMSEQNHTLSSRKVDNVQSQDDAQIHSMYFQPDESTNSPGHLTQDSLNITNTSISSITDSFKSTPVKSEPTEERFVPYKSKMSNYCELCENYFPNPGALRRHKAAHVAADSGQLFHCDVCGKGFAMKNKLQRHLRVHTLEKPHVCMFCNRGFSESGNLTVHMRLHTGERPYKCEACGRGFADHSNHKKHAKVCTGAGVTMATP
jgi:hypothetical protein